MDLRLLGIIGGSAIGLLGGIIGTTMSIRNTAPGEERRFAIQFAVGTWIGVTVFLIGLFAIPRPYNFLLWIPYAIALPLAIQWGNRKQGAIRSRSKQ